MPSVDDFAKIAGVKQGTGVVGKLCTVALVAFAAMGVGLFGIGGDWPKVSASLLGIVIVGGFFAWFVHTMLGYARQHPLEASLEGTDLLTWRLKALEVATTNQAPRVEVTNVSPPKEIESAPNDNGKDKA